MQPSHRYAETVDLDLREVNVVQFHMRSCCGTSQQKQHVLFQYSSDGGISWSTGLVLVIGDFQKAKYAFSFYFSQPKYNGLLAD